MYSIGPSKRENINKKCSNALDIPTSEMFLIKRYMTVYSKWNRQQSSIIYVYTISCYAEFT